MRRLTWPTLDAHHDHNRRQRCGMRALTYSSSSAPEAGAALRRWPVSRLWLRRSNEPRRTWTCPGCVLNGEFHLAIFGLSELNLLVGEIAHLGLGAAFTSTTRRAGR
jgi:hypothetical protein